MKTCAAFRREGNAFCSEDEPKRPVMHDSVAEPRSLAGREAQHPLEDSASRR